MEEKEIKQNEAIRGYIIRSLAKGYKNTLNITQLVRALSASGMIINPDIGKHLAYLYEKRHKDSPNEGYITFNDKGVEPYNAYQKDAAIKLTTTGVDLIEGRLIDDGVDI